MDALYYRCPVCREKLSPVGKSLLCPKSHCFDKARQGYVNLLRRPAPGDHGDNALMVEARTRFLNAGYYAPLSEELAAFLPGDARTVLDAGCGEGYYTERILKADEERVVCGADVSKQAIVCACRRTKAVFWSVSSVNDLPFFDGSFDALTCVFSPLALNEYKRVLKKNGTLILAIPLEDHLWELKAAIYDKPYRNQPADTALKGFDLIKKREIVYKADITGSQTIHDLFSMTPYRFNTSTDDIKKLDGIDKLKTTIAFALLIYRKKS